MANYISQQQQVHDRSPQRIPIDSEQIEEQQMPARNSVNITNMNNQFGNFNRMNQPYGG